MKFLSINNELNHIYNLSGCITVVVRDNGQTIDTFIGCTHSYIDFYGYRGIDITNIRFFDSVDDLEEEFFNFYYKYNKDEFLTLGYYSYPNETELFHRCLQRDPKTRSYIQPFPIHELGTLLLYKNENPLSLYDYIVKHNIEEPYNGNCNHPLYYCMLSSIIFEHLMIN